MVETIRRKPTITEAVQFKGTKESADEIRDWVVKNWPEIEVADYRHEKDYKYDYLEAESPTDDFELEVGDWLVKGADGKVFQIRDETFQRDYEIINGEITW